MVKNKSCQVERHWEHHLTSFYYCAIPTHACAKECIKLYSFCTYFLALKRNILAAVKKKEVSASRLLLNRLTFQRCWSVYQHWVQQSSGSSSQLSGFQPRWTTRFGVCHRNNYIRVILSI